MDDLFEWLRAKRRESLSQSCTMMRLSERHVSDRLDAIVENVSADKTYAA